jgi:hypothetical protein
MPIPLFTKEEVEKSAITNVLDVPMSQRRRNRFSRMPDRLSLSQMKGSLIKKGKSPRTECD